jgi:hypothetical protein
MVFMEMFADFTSRGTKLRRTNIDRFFLVRLENPENKDASDDVDSYLGSTAAISTNFLQLCFSR